MPFKIKLKKSRQYNVVSKNLFVISIELLDGVVVECTLGSESLGQECLENVCQRLSIAHSELFGLRFLWRGRTPRWVDLDRPLKRQLEKANSSHQLWLRLMYYSPAPLLDEMTRYHVFLQLKNDLSEGRIVCEVGQAVVLAAYSRQAEYGNHDPERHTVDYLKNLLPFPKQMTEGGQPLDQSKLNDGQLEYLTAAVIQQHQTLYNLPQAQAEEGYINTCRKLIGYGQEMFSAKDHSRQNDVDISISLSGITVYAKHLDNPKFYKWTDIKNVINHKRSFSIECHNPSENASYVFNSADEGKYVWRMCVLQHTFHSKQSLTNAHYSSTNVEQPLQPKFQNDGLSDSRDDLDCVMSNIESNNNLSTFINSVDLKPFAYGGSQQELKSDTSHPLNSSQRALSTSCLDLTVSNNILQSQNDLDKLRALLPSYRAAPDYDTAIQQKYNQQLQASCFPGQSGAAHAVAVNSVKALAYGSQPEIHRPIHYPDVTRHTAIVNSSVRLPDELSYGINPLRHDACIGFPVDNSFVQSRVHPAHYLNVYKPPPPYPSNGLVSNSTPDLAIASQSISPTGYPRSYIGGHVSGSSPDLVSSRTFLNRHYLSRLHGGNTHFIGYHGVQNVLPPAHGTYENLASVMDMPSRHYIIETPRHLTNHIQKVFDEQGNVMYCMPANQVPYRNHMMLQHQKLKTVSDSQEPIYENIPLPWQNEHLQSAARGFSFASAPDISKVTERKPSQPISIMLNNSPIAQANVNHPVAAPPPFNLNSQVKFASDNHYANAQVLKNLTLSTEQPSDKNVTNEKALKDDVPESALNSTSFSSPTTSEQSTDKNITEKTQKIDVQEITNTLSSISLFKEPATEERKSNRSLKSSITGININTNRSIQTSDNNNVTTITINSSESQPFVYGKEHDSFMRKSHTIDVINDSQQSEVLTQSSGSEFMHPSSSFFDTTSSTNYDFETSAASSNTSGSVGTKEKKKRRWMVFGGRSQKSEVKSATLGRNKEKKNSTKNDSLEKHRWSTGLPKLQPLPPSISKETMCQLLERKMADAQLALSFERIPKGRDTNADINVALDPENTSLNAGNSEFLPYEDNRVRLTPTKTNKQGYINASHITATVGSNQRFYIACSLGTMVTYNNFVGSLISNTFWQAVWEVGARVLAYISNNLTPDHLPELLPGRVKDFGQYQVFVESSQSTEFVVTTRLRLMNAKTNFGTTGTMGQMRTVWHLQYTEWPDNFTIPKSPEHFLGFLEDLTAVRQHCATEITPLHNANPPVFVACSQGVGRTGVTIASDLLLYTLDHNQELDIQRVIGLLHQQRANLIQNVHQYRFIHALLIHYLKQTRLI